MSSVYSACSICSQAFSSIDALSLARCGHMSHSHCLKQAAQKLKKCGTCGHTVQNVQKLFVSVSSSPVVIPETALLRLKKAIEQLEKENKDLLLKTKKKTLKRHAAICEKRSESRVSDGPVDKQYQTIDASLVNLLASNRGLPVFHLRQ
ncbi:hypothetical protein L596_013473 [Steinernema carpocapsae]|uniref:RING-type domain-containing protein n=1 Tax=Steinernema carpocapsae TaxID=34508 RepID=A0A4U5P092_STECR|nr:hypothetical protein L596_013473 [Steinernema carpocapsae]